MAGYAAQLEQYQKAIDIYEQVSFTWLSASATHLCLPPSVSTLSQATLTKCFFQLQPVLGVSCPSSWELSPELGILCRKSRARGRISRGGTLNHGKQQVPCVTAWRWGRLWPEERQAAGCGRRAGTISHAPTTTTPLPTKCQFPVYLAVVPPPPLTWEEAHKHLASFTPPTS